MSELDQGLLDRMTALVAQDRILHWSVIKREFWVHGVESMRNYLRRVETFTMAGRIESIRCPPLFTLAEGDPLAKGTQEFFASCAARST
jgi:hypothetical protein